MCRNPRNEDLLPRFTESKTPRKMTPRPDRCQHRQGEILVSVPGILGIRAFVKCAKNGNSRSAFKHDPKHFQVQSPSRNGECGTVEPVCKRASVSQSQRELRPSKDQKTSADPRRDANRPCSVRRRLPVGGLICAGLNWSGWRAPVAPIWLADHERLWLEVFAHSRPRTLYTCSREATRIIRIVCRSGINW